MTDTYGGLTFDDYHEAQISRYPSFANYHGTNFDSFTSWKDSLDWGYLLELDEQDKAHSVDYAHGLELDDFGADLNLPRNGLDDDTYRFYLKSHRLVTNSKGTFPDLVNVISNLLGCDIDDISISNDRKWSNGTLTGEENTIDIESIDITKINSPSFVPLLPSVLEKATLASTKVRQVGFYNSIGFTEYLGTHLVVTEKLEIGIPDAVESH